MVRRPPPIGTVALISSIVFGVLEQIHGDFYFTFQIFPVLIGVVGLHRERDRGRWIVSALAIVLAVVLAFVGMTTGGSTFGGSGSFTS